MRFTFRSSVLLFVLAAFGCSSAPAQPSGPAPFDPAGTYDFTAAVGEGMTIPGVLEITRDGYAYHTEATVEGETHAAVGDSIEVTGNHVVLHLLAGEGEPVTFHLDFTGATFTGAVATGEGSIPVSGTRRNP